MSSKLDKILHIYKGLCQTPILAGARVLRGGIINTIWSQRNIESGKNVKYLRMHVVDNNLNKVAETLPCDISNELLTAVSHSENNRAVLREISNGKEKSKQLLEIWNNDKLTNAVDLSALNVHGDIYTDGEFKSFAWSPDETKIVYIAEKKIQNREPFYKRKSDKSEGGNGDISVGEEYLYRQDWGEQLAGKYSSVIAMYDLQKDCVKILEGVPVHLCPGQIAWSPDGTYIVGVALETEPRKLGLIYCTNRVGAIFKLDFSGNYAQLSEEGKSVFSPQFSPDGRHLIWFEKDAGGPHHAAMTLMCLELPAEPSTKPNVVVNIVENEIATTNGESFYGIFNANLPQRCWATDNRRILLSTPQKNTIKTYVINIETGGISELKYNGGSLVLLDVHNDILLLSGKNYLYPDKLIAAKLPEAGNENTIEWKELTKPENIKFLENVKYEYMELVHDTQDKVKNFSAIYLGPKEAGEKKIPLIVWPHGGPHSAFFNTFALEPSLLVSLGYAVLFVNYRGSTGAGQESVKFLLGRVGDADVKDCVLAAKECIRMCPWIDVDKLALVGGSHGGFIIHHLSGQYPDMFKAVVSRNPVIDIASMSIVSDIPDWCTVEAGSSYTQKGEVNNELLLAMRKASPIQHAHKIKAPTYLMLGSKDLRVPCSQGLELYHRLKANGVPVKVNMYEDNHALSSVPNEMDHVINSALWLLEYCS